MRRVWVGMGLAVLLVGGAAVAAMLAWPAGAIAGSATGLAGISLPGYAGHVESVSVTGPGGKPLSVYVHGGTIWPHERLAPGERLTVTVDIRRPGWIGWLVGGEVERTLTVVTPQAHVRETLLRPARGGAVSVRFSEPVTQVAIGAGRARKLGQGRTTVPLGIVASGSASAGTTTVAAAPRQWETLAPPVRVSWFAPGARTQVVSDPVRGTRLTPTNALTLTFAQPVAEVLGSARPRLWPATAGRWDLVDAHTLSFRPAGFGYPLGGTVHVHLPGRTLAWHVAPGSTLRLQQLLARLGYLPLRWRIAKDPPDTPASEAAAAVSPPAGAFSWRFADTPASLRTLWAPGKPNLVTQAAVMSFEEAHGLATDGIAGPQVWRALLRDAVAGKAHTGGYTYVFVHETIPESLNLWHNGKVILTSPGNTGIPQAPTAPGTWPVYEHIPSGTMSGTNPDGSHYNDPGVLWISYFHGGDAIHAFPRASYGTPQSLGCVELPTSAAAEVWPYTPIGTLVTIEP